jgi:hypothetical protein
MNRFPAKIPLILFRAMFTNAEVPPRLSCARVTFPHESAWSVMWLWLAELSFAFRNSRFKLVIPFQVGNGEVQGYTVLRVAQYDLLEAIM